MPYRPKITPEDRREIVRMLAETTMTLKEIAQRFGVTRERVRQIGAYVGISGGERIANRAGVVRTERLPNAIFSEGYKAVWHEAARNGLTVKAYCNEAGRFYGDELFINRRLCHISHVVNKIQTSPHTHRWYAHVGELRGVHKTRTLIVIVDNAISGEREFYVFPTAVIGSLPRNLNIPLNESPCPNRRKGIDYSPYKNAWHLLAPIDESVDQPLRNEEDVA